jgi:hypothetical protein
VRQFPSIEERVNQLPVGCVPADDEYPLGHELRGAWEAGDGKNAKKWVRPESGSLFLE